MPGTTQQLATAMGKALYASTISLSSTNTKFTPPTNGGLLNNEYFLAGLLLVFSGRITNAASGNPSGTQGDAPYSLINRVRVWGQHIPTNSERVLYDVRGADVREFVGDLTGRFPYYNAPTLDKTASATNDIKFALRLPFHPAGINPAEKPNWLLDAPNYDGLNLEVFFGDDKQVFTGQTTASTFSAYGSTSGNPALDIYLIRAMSQSKFKGFLPGWCKRSYQEATTIVQSSGNDQRILNINRGSKITRLMLKTGVKSTVVTSGNDAFNTLSDDILTTIRVNRGQGVYARRYQDFVGLKEDSAQYHAVTPSKGYGVVDFMPHGFTSEALDLTDAVAGPSGNVDCYLEANVSGASNQAALMLTEELMTAPVTAS